MLYPHAQPNRAHTALAEMERDGHIAACVTQNIDGLHQAAGSRRVLELHGSVHRNGCMDCKATYPLSFILESSQIPRCTRCGGIIKPDVVLYGETLDEDTVRKACGFLRRADLLIVGGTSLAVYPAAGFIGEYRGERLVLINLGETPADTTADLVIHAPIEQALFDAYLR